MKKIHILTALVLCLASCLPARAEGGLIEFGIKAGVTTQSTKFGNTTKYDGGDFDISTNGRFGYHLGILSRVNLPLVHFQPEILFSNTGYRLNAVRSSDTYPSKSIVRFRTLDVPVLVGMRMMWLRLQAGPMFTVMSESNLKDKSLVADVHVTKPSVSYLLGLGLDLKRMNFDVRFNGNFKKTTQDITYESRTQAISYRTKHKYWMFSFGYLF